MIQTDCMWHGVAMNQQDVQNMARFLRRATVCFLYQSRRKSESPRFAKCGTFCVSKFQTSDRFSVVPPEFLSGLFDDRLMALYS